MGIKLRPHHLLCTQGYSGKGYSEEFVEHMNEVVAMLRREEPTLIDLTFSTDTYLHPAYLQKNVRKSNMVLPVQCILFHQYMPNPLV